MPERAPQLPRPLRHPTRTLAGLPGLLMMWLTLLGLGVDGVERALAGQCVPESAAMESTRTTVAVRAGGPQADTDEGVGRAWWNLWSESSTEDRVLWGMWSTHLNRKNDIWQNDEILALIYRGFYAGTFRTTHGPQAYSLGVERSWVEGSAGPLLGMVGFRAGLVYGYDRRLGWVAEKYPVLPFAQPVLYGRLGPLTTDLTYTWVVISLTAGLRF
jgi:hypothetical protein